MCSAINTIIHETAQIDDNAVIHPGCIIGENVVIGAGCEIGPNAVVVKDTVMGARNRIHPFASVGGDSQHKSYAGQATQLIIGDDNVIRECVTINRGDPVGGSVTRIGDRNLFMAYSHVAHDVDIGNDVVVVNHANIAGHVKIEDHVVVGAYVGIAQFCHIGAHAFLTMAAGISKDVLPFTNITHVPAMVRGINLVGLKRRGFNSEDTLAIKATYRAIFGDQDTEELDELKALSIHAKYMIEFWKNSKKGLVIPRKLHSAEA